MIIAIIVIAIFFTWLLYETDFLKIRLEGTPPKKEMALVKYNPKYISGVIDVKDTKYVNKYRRFK